MPRPIGADLTDALQRPNPSARAIVEVSVPDVSLVFRRPDQFNGEQQLSQTPSNTLATDSLGRLSLAPIASVLASAVNHTGDHRDMNGEPTDQRLRGLAFEVDPKFRGCVLRGFEAKVGRVSFFGGYYRFTFKLQIWRATGVGSQYVTRDPTGKVLKRTDFIDWTFTQLLPQDVTIPYSSVDWGGGTEGWAIFDLTNYNLVLEHKNFPPSSPGNPGELQKYYFQVDITSPSSVDGAVNWEWQAGVTTKSNVGKFYQVDWVYDGDKKAWEEHAQDGLHGYGSNCPLFKLDIQSYPRTGVGVFAVDLGKVPTGSLGRVKFDRSVPPGTSVSLELSANDVSGPYQSVTDGSIVPLAQQNYWMRVGLYSTAPFYRTPSIIDFGIEWLTPIDVSVDAIMDYLQQEVSLPFLAPAIADTTISIVRSGRRDYEDFATMIALSGPTTKLECDVWIDAPSVPSGGRFHVGKSLVSTRTPADDRETLTCISFSKKLKVKIPGKVESINSVHTVIAVPTSVQVQVSPVLLSTGTDAYDGAGYYIRVQKSATPSLVGVIAVIDGNSSTDKLDFAPNALPSPLVVGDVIEVHSGRFVQATLSWADADPSDVIIELMTVRAGFPIERIGRRPPTVAERAPGDSATQAKLLVTNKIDSDESADELIDQLSFLLGGAMIDTGDKMEWRQVYPSRGPDGSIIIAPDRVSVVFDPRDYIGLDCPTGLEKRVTVMSCNYGVNKTTANPDATPVSTTFFADADASASLDPQDLDGIGYSEIDDKIARWCYNSADGGLYLASLACQQVVLAFSTGMREWSWSSTEQYPELCVGDCVSIVTDRYTDMDPATGKRYSGWFAYSLVLTHVSGGGRVFRGAMLGLVSSAIKVVGGPGTRPGAGALIPVPDVTLTEVRTDQGADGPSAIFINASWDPIEDPFFDHMEYKVQQLWPGDQLGLFTVNTRVVGSRRGPDMIAATFGLEYNITPITVSIGGVENEATTPLNIVMSAQLGVAGIASVVAGSSSIIYNMSYPAGTLAYSIYYKQFAADPGLVNVEKTGTFYGQVWQTTDAMPVIILPVDPTNPWVAVTIYPFTSSGRSRAYLDRQQRNGAAVVPSTPATPTTQANPIGGPVTIRTFYSSGAATGDIVRLYRDGVLVFTHILTSGDVTAGHYDVVDTSAHAATTYSYTSSFVSNSTGSESAQSSADSVTTPSSTLAAPSGFTAVRSGDPTQVNLHWTTSDQPVGTKYQVESSPISGTSGFTTIGSNVSGGSFGASAGTGQTWFRVKAKLSPYTDSGFSTASVPAYHGPV